MKKTFAFGLALCMLVAMLTACNGGTSSSTPAQTSESSQAQSATETPATEMPKFLTVGTGATGGAYYPIGVAVAEILTNNLGTQSTAQVTGGALENLQLVEAGTCDIGITQGNTAMDAYNATGDYAQAYQNISALFGGLSKGYFQIVVLESSAIQTMEDLIGKKVCMGPAGNGAIGVASNIWAEYGFGLDDISATYLSYDDGISQLEDGNCDAVVVQAAIPSSAIQQLAASGKGYRFIEVSEEVATKLCESYGYFGYGTLGASVYENNDVDTNTMYITNMMVVRSDMEEAVVYEMTKSIFENIDTVKNSHKAASGLSVEEAVKVSIPLHPGAQRYFEEIGAV